MPVACPGGTPTLDSDDLISSEGSSAFIETRCWADDDDGTVPRGVGFYGWLWGDGSCTNPPSTSLGLCWKHGREILGPAWTMRNHGKVERV